MRTTREVSPALAELYAREEDAGRDPFSPSVVVPLGPAAPPPPPLQLAPPPWSEHYQPDPPREPDPALHREDEQAAPAKPQAKWGADQMRGAA